MGVNKTEGPSKSHTPPGVPVVARPVEDVPPSPDAGGAADPVVLELLSNARLHGSMLACSQASLAGLEAVCGRGAGCQWLH